MGLVQGLRRRQLVPRPVPRGEHNQAGEPGRRERPLPPIDETTPRYWARMTRANSRRLDLGFEEMDHVLLVAVRSGGEVQRVREV